MSDLLEKINNIVWGNGLVFLLLATGIIFTLRLGFIQFRMPSFLLNGKKSQNSGLSQLKTVCMSLGTTMGTGNITGTASAIAVGGAGAVFWLWVSAFLGMAVVYAENVLSAKYSDESCKGPMAYLAKGLGSPWLAWIFALFCVLASFGMGGMVQVNTFAVSFAEISDVSSVCVFVCVFVLIFAITSGGAERIGTSAQYLLPVASVAYAAACVAVLVMFRENIPDVFGRIFAQAFNFRSVSGGIAGYAVSVGIRRGIFSNEAGLGSSPILHSSAGDTDPRTQGMWSMFEVFFDTILCCTLTAVTLLCADDLSVSGTFSAVLGKFSEPFITAELGIFALCTVIGWYFCGETAFRYITGRDGKIFCLIYAVISASGALFSAKSVWTLSDIFNGLMAFPNLVGLLFLMKHVRRE
ncbi:MAG: amino acid carrier protein [Ruminococcus flavefaciens]|nr:amino acid carrier protein [Ruminococcus flavefaciens]MCM1229223.1 amino acid carrier protein [Ruminococcus flavefaciens]